MKIVPNAILKKKPFTSFNMCLLWRERSKQQNEKNFGENNKVKAQKLEKGKTLFEEKKDLLIIDLAWFFVFFLFYLFYLFCFFVFHFCGESSALFFLVILGLEFDEH
eukprot:PhF_6_TR40448/c2_g1_i1/m.60408